MFPERDHEIFRWSSAIVHPNGVRESLPGAGSLLSGHHAGEGTRDLHVRLHEVVDGVSVTVDVRVPAGVIQRARSIRADLSPASDTADEVWEAGHSHLLVGARAALNRLRVEAQGSLAAMIQAAIELRRP